MKQYPFLHFSILLISVTLLSACHKSSDSVNEIKTYKYKGIQYAYYNSKMKDSTGNYIFAEWDSTYQDEMTVKLDVTQELIYFIFNKSNHATSPAETEYVTTIKKNIYSIPLGYRIRYDFRFANDSIFAEYYNLDGLTDTFFFNKKLIFSGKIE